jgi:hypothetical protein
LRDTHKPGKHFIFTKTLGGGPGINISSDASQFWHDKAGGRATLIVHQSSCINGISYNTLAAILKRQNDFNFASKKTLQDRIFQISLKSFRMIAC